MGYPLYYVINIMYCLFELSGEGIALKIDSSIILVQFRQYCHAHLP